MKRDDTNHSIIEFILRLVNFPEYNETSQAISAEDTPMSSASVSDVQKIQTAYDVIAFMDEMPGGLLIYHADGNEEIIYANKALLRIFKCDTLDEFCKLTGNSFRGIVHPDDLDEIEKSIGEQIASSQYDLDYVEYRIIRKDGEIRWIDDYGHFIHSDTVGDIFYVFMSDSTEKKKRHLQEKATLISEKEKSEQKIKNLIEEYDKEKKIINQEQLRRLEVIEGLSVNYESILYVNLQEDKIFPYRLSTRTEHQFGGKFQVLAFSWYTPDYINTWVHPEDRERVSRATTPEYIREKLSNSKTYYINYRIVINEETQYLQLRVVNVGNPEQVSQLVMGYRRVDKEVRREMEQKQILEEALHNANLAIKAKNTFLSNMSHDIRTPLNAIFGFTSLAKKHIDETDTVARYLDRIETSGKQLLSLLDNVLELSWTEAKDIHISESECNLIQILSEIHKALLPRADKKNIQFSLDMTGLGHCDVYSDADKLKQMLTHLASNAIKYTENNGIVTITALETEKVSKNYNIYQFCISDTGIGISKEYIERIFEPFEREKNTTFSGIHGTGLGLTISKSIVDMMGGRISVESTPGKGSTFTVTLQLRTQNEPLSHYSSSTESTLTHLMSQKILLVEDNEINLEIETELLEGLGLSIDTAKNGKIGVEKITNSKPDEYALVLMDIQMPVMNGWQAAKAIRSLEDKTLSSIPIIALSADAFESDKRTSLESGMDAHLTKPIDIPLLLETIIKTLQAHTPAK